eukprot:4479760-Lingulodinium_polyedra.AAC.1
MLMLSLKNDARQSWPALDRANRRMASPRARASRIKMSSTGCHWPHSRGAQSRSWSNAAGTSGNSASNAKSSRPGVRCGRTSE